MISYVFGLLSSWGLINRIYFVLLAVIVFFLVIFVFFKIFNRVAEDFFSELIQKLYSENDLKHIMDNLEESIIVIENDSIEFVNDTFIE